MPRDAICQDHEGGHCWHLANWQHAVPNHEDKFCCWCKESRCFHYHTEPMPGHGPYAPEVIVKES